MLQSCNDASHLPLCISSPPTILSSTMADLSTVAALYSFIRSTVSGWISAPPGDRSRNCGFTVDLHLLGNRTTYQCACRYIEHRTCITALKEIDLYTKELRLITTLTGCRNTASYDVAWKVPNDTHNGMRNASLLHRIMPKTHHLKWHRVSLHHLLLRWGGQTFSTSRHSPTRFKT